ncbi:MAG: PLP-dependent transferase [Methylorubrum extorquens]|uniref:PLP-dependent transferase n=1 Tax=Methylorubrum extorquens TaxID=408 RepID=UPI001FCAF3FF
MQPASTSHSHLTPDEPRAADVTDGSVRLAVGLANIDEIRTHLDRALAGGGGGGPPSRCGGARREVRNKACQTAFSR